MKNTININIKKLPTGYYLATSDDYIGLVATGKTISSALQAVKTALRKLLKV